MNIAIIYAPRQRKVEAAAQALGQFMKNKGHKVSYLRIGEAGRPPSIRQYDFVYFGSVAEGTFGGKIPAEVSDYIKQCRGFQNSKTATFLIKRLFGNTKGMKNFMGLLESMGSQVMDFEVISHPSAIEALGQRLI